MQARLSPVALSLFSAPRTSPLSRAWGRSWDRAGIRSGSGRETHHFWSELGHMATPCRWGVWET